MLVTWLWLLPTQLLLCTGGSGPLKDPPLQPICRLQLRAGKQALLLLGDSKLLWLPSCPPRRSLLLWLYRNTLCANWLLRHTLMAYSR